MTDLRIIAGYALREAVRRRVLLVVVVLTRASSRSTRSAANEAFEEVSRQGGPPGGRSRTRC